MRFSYICSYQVICAKRSLRSRIVKTYKVDFIPLPVALEIQQLLEHTLQSHHYNGSQNALQNDIMNKI